MGYTIDKAFVKALRASIPETQIFLDEPMSHHTTFRIGGNADIFVLPASIEELLHILKLTKEYAVPLTILGNGSNILVRDGGLRGLVISFGKPFAYIKTNGKNIVAGAGSVISSATTPTGGWRRRSAAGWNTRSPMVRIFW